jgi:hypothetical protein
MTHHISRSPGPLCSFLIPRFLDHPQITVVLLTPQALRPDVVPATRSIRVRNRCLVSFGNRKSNTSAGGINDEDLHFVISIESRHEDKSLANVSAGKSRVVMHCDHTLDVSETVGFLSDQNRERDDRGNFGPVFPLKRPAANQVSRHSSRISRMANKQRT